ncbi:hypothetical protein [Comamonas jiangduensis]|uniref:hypothetical protein n=1 Tax=Comamonas jiangduensis TaxID=1194168 RepID=UPI003BF8D5A2
MTVLLLPSVVAQPASKDATAQAVTVRFKESMYFMDELYEVDGLVKQGREIE